MRFCQLSVKFLGYLISEKGIEPLPHRVKAINEFQQPKTIKDLRRVLALLNFYRRFLKNAAHEQSLLSDYLKGAKKNDTCLINWTEEVKLAFESCKNSLAMSTLSVYPSSDARLSLTCDASDRALGSVLSQEENGEWKSLAFFHGSLLRLNSDIAYMTVNCWRFMRPFVIFLLCWNSVILRSIQITSL
ncbi:Retrovirus-related Pol polyprotein from transposon opus [Araneus ventricosus]|uniref:Retrovirus-related Pol polyprotein from transposon opus n=1 Tax=Araneus ventricosus TaxID=182803 RepID=A0A4Y2FSS4_ARAVE|nr:Retrovirus-related Pol polyprotein from transposon opus [Araneus ventricosus]